MAVQLILASHSPLMLMGMKETQGDAQARFNATMKCVADELESFSPDLVLTFGPDHFNGFFYDLMPSFCVGVRAEGLEDWQIKGGEFIVPKELAEDCVRHLHAHDIDIAISYEMKVDHGTTISLAQIAGSVGRYPVLPIFINCAADPRPSMRRVRTAGGEIGRFLAATGMRVAILGSGGLSHDPPTPRLAKVSGDLAKRLIRRSVPTKEELRAREDRVINAALQMVKGEGPCLPPDPVWDAEFLKNIIQGHATVFDTLTDSEIDSRAGFGGHEVRTWVAGRAAASAFCNSGSLSYQRRFYEVIPEWITGMGIVTATHE